MRKERGNSKNMYRGRGYKRRNFREWGIFWKSQFLLLPRWPPAAERKTLRLNCLRFHAGQWPPFVPIEIASFQSCRGRRGDGGGENYCQHQIPMTSEDCAIDKLLMSIWLCHARDESCYYRCLKWTLWQENSSAGTVIHRPASNQSSQQQYGLSIMHSVCES